MRSDACDKAVADLPGLPDNGVARLLATGQNGNGRLIWVLAIMIDDTRMSHLATFREGDTSLRTLVPGGYMPHFTVLSRSAEIDAELLLAYLNGLRPEMYEVPNTVESIVRLFLKAQLLDATTWYATLCKALEPYATEAHRLRLDIGYHAASDEQIERLTTDVVYFLWERRPW